MLTSFINLIKKCLITPVVYLFKTLSMLAGVAFGVLLQLMSAPLIILVASFAAAYLFSSWLLAVEALAVIGWAGWYTGMYLGFHLVAGDWGRAILSFVLVSANIIALYNGVLTITLAIATYVIARRIILPFYALAALGLDRMADTIDSNDEANAY